MVTINSITTLVMLEIVYLNQNLHIHLKHQVQNNSNQIFLSLIFDNQMDKSSENRKQPF
jgi:hypothetical protein